jgi:hypothetical protein
MWSIALRSILKIEETAESHLAAAVKLDAQPSAISRI